MDYSSSDSPLYELIRSGRHYQLPRGQVVNAFDDVAKLNLIDSGYIQRYLITKEGNKGIQVLYGPGDIFPLTPVYKSVFQMDIYSGPEEYYYEAMTPLSIYSIAQEDLKGAVDKNPLLYKDLFYAAGLRLNSYIHRLESMSLRAATRKIAHQLAYLATIFGSENSHGTTITIPLTHKNIADILNLARETVTLCMSRLEEKGLIEADKHIIVKDLERLRSMSR